MSTDTLGYQDIAFSAQPADRLQALLDRLQALEEKVASQDEEIACLKATIARQGDHLADLERQQDYASEQDLIQLRLIKDLREEIKPPEPQPMQQDRGDILRALLAANDGKMLLKDARRKMHLSKSRFSELLATVGEYIETKPFSRDHRQKVLVLK